MHETFDEGETIFETDALRFWHQHDGIGILSFKTKMNTLNEGVLDGILEALARAERELKGLIIWQRHGNDFSAGANLLELGEAVKAKGLSAADNILKKFQQMALALRYSMVPTIAAIRGRALGGGCELAMHCDRIVAHLETYIGLVEVGVGLLPAGGGLKEFALRAAIQSEGDIDQLQASMKNSFRQIAMAEVSSSGHDAKRRQFLRPQDLIIFNSDEILYVAKRQIEAMLESVYRPVLRPKIAVAGKAGIANLRYELVNYREGGFISDYDYQIADTIANVICGGEVEPGSLVDETWLLRLEREGFLQLLAQDKTQQRIKHLLETGKPLRN